MPLLIGVDIGTQGTKAAIYTDSGNLIAEAFERSTIVHGASGEVEEDADRQAASVLRTVASTVKQIGDRSDDVAALAIDGQMAGVIGIDSEGHAITPYDSWLDTRCAPQIAAMAAVAGDEVLRKTGCAPSFNHGPKILWWRDEHPEIFDRIAKFVQPAGYAASRLCGHNAEAAYVDATYLHFSGFADTERSEWDAGLCRAFSLPMEKLPKIVAAHDVVGRVSEDAARETGMRAGVPVVAGCGDTAASFLSCGAVSPGICVDVAGTASVFAATTAGFRPDVDRRVLACGRSAVPGLWHPYAYINGGGMNLEWFRREFADDEHVSIADLDRAASGVPWSASSPLFVPHLAGRVSPSSPLLRGAWVGLDWTHGRGHLYRAALESVALEYGIYCDALRALYPESELREIRVTGGGEVSALWNKIKASALQMPVVKVDGAGGAPMGSAMLAGFGAGVLSDLTAAADEWVRSTPGAEPDPGEARFFRARIERYGRLLDLLQDYHAEVEA